MSRYIPSEDLRGTLADLPTPTEYFSGVDGWFRELPRNILVFARKSPYEAMDGGLHLHPRFVFCWCVECGGGIMVDGSMLRLEPGQGLLLFPFQQHYFSSFQRENILWAFVTFELESRHLLDHLRSTPIEIDAVSAVHLEEVLAAFRAGIAGDSRAGGSVAARLTLLLGGLAERAGEGECSHASGVARIEDPRLPQVIRHVYAHLDRPLTISEVAESVHISPSHLRRLFRREMGISLGRFMLQARLNHAFSLLHTTELPVARVADACGFASVYSFSRAFRSEKGVAPSAARR